jgi:hypothetical protein
VHSLFYAVARDKVPCTAPLGTPVALSVGSCRAPAFGNVPRARLRSATSARSGQMRVTYASEGGFRQWAS